MGTSTGQLVRPRVSIIFHRREFQLAKFRCMTTTTGMPSLHLRRSCGNQSAAYLGTLTFDIYDNYTDSSLEPAVMISDGTNFLYSPLLLDSSVQGPNMALPFGAVSGIDRLDKQPVWWEPGIRSADAKPYFRISKSSQSKRTGIPATTMSTR